MQGLDVAFGGARQFNCATEPAVDVLADRVVVAGTANRHRELRLRRGLQRVTGDLTVRVALGVHRGRLEGQAVGQVVAAGGEDRLVTAGLLQHHLIDGVVVVVGGDFVVVVGDVARIGAHATAVERTGMVEDVGLVVRSEAAPRAGRAQTVFDVVRAGRITGQRAILRPHRIFVGVVGAKHQRGAVGGGAGGEGILLLGTVATTILAEVRRGFCTVVVLTQDDVHHTGHGVGAVDCRGAVLQDFDALDQRARDRGHVGQTRQAAGPTLAVHEHQGTVLTQVVQVDVLATLLRIGCQHRSLAVGLRTGDRQVLEDVTNADQARLLNVLLRHGENRLCGFHIDRADARAGNFDAVQRRGRRGGLLLCIGGKCRRQRDRNTGGQQAQPHCGGAKVHQSLQGSLVAR